MSFARANNFHDIWDQGGTELDDESIVRLLGPAQTVEAIVAIDNNFSKTEDKVRDNMAKDVTMAITGRTIKECDHDVQYRLDKALKPDEEKAKSASRHSRRST